MIRAGFIQPQKKNEAKASFLWCPGTDLNRRHKDFQSHALPTELPGHMKRLAREKAMSLTLFIKKACDLQALHHFQAILRRTQKDLCPG